MPVVPRGQGIQDLYCQAGGPSHSPAWSKSYGVLVGQARAAQVGAPLTMVPDLAAYEGGAGARLGLAGAHQRVNAALAVALAGAWEARYAAEHKVW